MVRNRKPITQNTAANLMVGGIAGFLLISVGSHLSELESWSDLLAPRVSGPLLAELGTALTAVFGALRMQGKQ